MSSPRDKDRITCHVLDTTLGRPARGVRVKLELNSPHATTSAAISLPMPTPTKVFESQTDDDGRIKSWLPYSSATSSGEVPLYTLDDVLGDLKQLGGGSASRWTLRFDTEAYFAASGQKTFFPEAVVTFRFEEGGGHYHVPLLLAPYGYSTYRGA